MRVTLMTEVYQTYDVDYPALEEAYGDSDLRSHESIVDIVEGELEDQGESLTIPWLHEITEEARAHRSVFEVDLQEGADQYELFQLRAEVKTLRAGILALIRQAPARAWQPSDLLDAPALGDASATVKSIAFNALVNEGVLTLGRDWTVRLSLPHPSELAKEGQGA